LLVALLVLIPLVPATGTSLGAQLAGRVAAALLPALAVMAIVLVVVLSIRLARACNYPVPLFTVTCGLAFVLSLPRPIVSPPLAYLRILGSCGLFLAMLVCLIVAAFFWGAGRVSPAPRKYAIGALLAVGAFAGLWVLGISPANVVLEALRPLGSLGDSYAALLVVVVVETLLWIGGIHGPAVLAAVVTPLYLTLQSENANAFAHHQPLPHIVVVSLFLFVFPGGAGATLPLAVLLAISRVPRLRMVGRLTLLPALFNSNEPLLFGLPVVFNPMLFIPFVVAPVVLATITYLTVAAGWVGRPIFYWPSSIPTLVSTYLATLDWRACVLVLVNVCVAGAIYFPFVRAYERHELAASAAAA
jgi:PTS system cellobiose-specific IIC component